MVGIESDGSVKGCLSIQPGNNPERDRFIEGNLREQSLAEIWNRPGAFAYSREWSLDDLSGFCRRCPFAERCRGGCRSSQVAFGGGDGNPLCVYRALAERRAKSGTATAGTAAAVLAAFLAFGVQGCAGCQSGMAMYDFTCTDTDCDGDTDTDTDTDSDTGTDTDTDTDTDPNPDGGVDGGADAGQ